MFDSQATWQFDSNVSLTVSLRTASDEEPVLSVSLVFKMSFSFSDFISSLPSTSKVSSLTKTKSSCSISSGDLEREFDETERLLEALEERSLSLERDLDLERDSDRDLDLDLCFRFLCFFLSLDLDLDECFLCLCFLERFSFETSPFFLSTSGELAASSLPLSSFM